MEEFKIITNRTLGNSEVQLYSDTNGAIVKSILLSNSKSNEVEATLTIDSVAFKFKLAAGETKIINSVIMMKNLKATGDGLGIHITALQLGGA